MSDGWIKLHRKLLDWEWYTDDNARSLFIHLLITANHKDNKYRGILIKRGATMTGIPTLSKEIGKSVQSIRNGIKKLKSTGDITVQSTNLYSIITISNWDFYQDINSPDNSQATDEQQTSNNKQECKNEKNEKKEKKNITAKAAKKSRLPSDWVLPDEWGDWAMEKGLTHDQVFKAWPSFKSYHIGKGTLALDWKATWQTWVFNIINKGW